jgi:hypothetical protein
VGEEPNHTTARELGTQPDLDRMFLGLPDSEPSLFCTDPDPDPSINKQKSKKNLYFYFFMTSF